MYWIIPTTINPVAKYCCAQLVVLHQRDRVLSQQINMIEELV